MARERPRQRYQEVSDLLWTDDKFWGLDDAAQKLFLYLLTNQHRITEGLYRLPVAYACHDLCWPREKFTQNLEVLIRKRFVKFDDSLEIVFLCNALKYQAPKGDRSIGGAMARLAALPDTYLFFDLIESAYEHAPEFHTRLSESYADHINKDLLTPLKAPSMGLTTVENQSEEAPSKGHVPSISISSSISTSSSISKRGDDDDENETRELLKTKGFDETVIDEALVRTRRQGSRIKSFVAYATRCADEIKAELEAAERAKEPKFRDIDGVRHIFNPETQQWAEVG